MKVTRKGTNVTVTFQHALIVKMLLIVAAAAVIFGASAKVGLSMQTNRCHEWEHVASALSHSVPNVQLDDIRSCIG